MAIDRVHSFAGLLRQCLLHSLTGEGIELHKWSRWAPKDVARNLVQQNCESNSSFTWSFEAGSKIFVDQCPFNVVSEESPVCKCENSASETMLCSCRLPLTSSTSIKTNVGGGREVACLWPTVICHPHLYFHRTTVSAVLGLMACLGQILMMETAANLMSETERNNELTHATFEPEVQETLWSMWSDNGNVAHLCCESHLSLCPSRQATWKIMARDAVSWRCPCNVHFVMLIFGYNVLQGTTATLQQLGIKSKKKRLTAVRDLGFAQPWWICSDPGENILESLASQTIARQLSFFWSER